MKAAIEAVDSIDRKVLQRIADAGTKGTFLAHPAHEKRAWDLSNAGFVKREQAVYRMQVMADGSQRVEFRNLYTLKPKGRRILA